jgi:hypothetical protein
VIGRIEADMAEVFTIRRHLLVLGCQSSAHVGRRDDANDIGKAPTFLQKKNPGYDPMNSQLNSHSCHLRDIFSHLDFQALYVDHAFQD